MTPTPARDRLWKTIRQLKTFTARQAMETAKVSDDTVRAYCESLTSAGYLAVKDRHPRASGYGAEIYGKTRQWTLVKDPGPVPPRLHPDGTEKTHGLATEQLWRTMRILGEFSVQDLVVQASTERVPIVSNSAAAYVRALCRAGYIVRTGQRRPARYRFLKSRHTGPQPPVIRKGSSEVYDPNLDLVVWTRRGGRHDQR